MLYTTALNEPVCVGIQACAFPAF